MSNIAVFNPSQVPAYLKTRELSAMAKALAGGGGGGRRISIKGGVFRLMSDGKEVASIDERFLDVVLVNAAPKISRVFYAKKWSPEDENKSAPTCWSPDGEKPSPEVSAPPAPTCASCPNNIAGSGEGNSRACRYQQRLAVVLANDIEGDVLQLALPATSIFGKEDGDKRPLQAYARWLAAQSVSPETVVTRLRFDTAVENPKLFFKAMRYLTDDEFATVEQQAKSEDAIKAITMTVSKMDSAPADALAGTKPTRAAATAPVEDAEEPAPPPAPKAQRKAKPAPVETAAAADDEEPEVRKPAAKTPAGPAKKTNLADLVADWDDE